jgi:hypothetical protein
MRPLKRPMFRTGGPIKEGVMNGLKDGGVATYMADATMMAGGGRAALVGNPIFPKGPDGRAMHAQTYTIGGQTFTLPETASEVTRRNVNLTGSSTPRTGVVNTNAAQNLSRTKKAIQGAKNIYNKIPFRSIYDKIPKNLTAASTAGPFATMAGIPLLVGGSGGILLGKTADIFTKAYDTPKAYSLRKQIMKEDPFTFDETNLEVGDALARIQAADKIGKKPGLFPRGGYKEFLKREGIDEKGDPIVEKVEEEVVPKSTKNNKKFAGLSKKEIEEYDKKLEQDKLDRIYKLLGVDRAKSNAASKALIDMSRYIDEGGKDVISKKNLGSTISKAIGAFDKRLDKVDQLKEAAGLMIAKGEIEKDIYQAKGSEISKRINYLVNNYGYSKEQALSMVNKEPYDVRTALAAATAGKRGAALTNNERANAIREGANKEGKELQIVADRNAIKEGELTGKSATDVAISQWESEADDGYYLYGSSLVEIKTVDGKPVAEIIEGSEIIKK